MKERYVRLCERYISLSYTQHSVKNMYNIIYYIVYKVTYRYNAICIT